MGELVQFNKPASLAKPDKDSLIGKLLMLNSGAAPKFQCGGFSVNSGRLVDIVTERTQLAPIQAALATGLLIDVSDNNIVTKGFELKNSSASNIQTEDTDKKVFVGKDKHGRMFVIVPKDDEERALFESQIAETGTITYKPSESEGFTGFSPIVETELPGEV
jgi:hypothetical protein